MPNVFTRVPAGPPPQPTGLAAKAVPVADLFMGAMLSRPGGLSLRDAWVTPSTFWMCVALGAGGPVAAVALGLTGLAWWHLLGALVAAMLAVGAAAVAVVGAGQRRARRD